VQVTNAPHMPVHGLPGPQAPLPAGESTLIGLAALAAVLLPFVWPIAQHLSVMAHEGAHAAVGSLLGFTLQGVELNPNATGATGGNFTPGPRDILVTFAGYLGPSAVGLGAAKLISRGYIVAVLWLAIILLALLLVLVRWSFGLISVPAAIAAFVWLLKDRHTGAQVIAAYALTWLLLLAGIRVAIMRGANASDAHHLRDTAFLPRRFWSVLWLCGSVWALAVGGSMLVLYRGHRGRPRTTPPAPRRSRRACP
jgi:Peptidase M50B-like